MLRVSLDKIQDYYVYRTVSTSQVLDLYTYEKYFPEGLSSEVVF